MQVEWWLWAGTTAGVLALLGIDLFVVGRRARQPSMKEVTGWVVLYSLVAIAFGVLILTLHGGRYAAEFYAGWLTEYSLSVDNLFVFVIIMSRFAVPAAYQQRVLTVGIVLALCMRGLFIAVGAVAISRFSWVFYLFGALLIHTAWNLARHDGEQDSELPDNLLLRAVRRVLPTTTSYDGRKLLTRVNGRPLVTPMLVVMIAIGTTDVLFALDSIPAIFGLTKEPFLVLTANAFALLGLRQLYFLIGGLLDRLVYLSYGLAVVLGFIGLKLTLEALHTNTLPFLAGGNPIHIGPDISITFSLGFIAGTLIVTTGASLVKDRHTRRTHDTSARAEVRSADPVSERG
ncbi:MAG TPA: TerC family protein [Kineosporiaceae bacterium]|nr:TerC family protein [Kineosporiaceae bacterium]